MSDVHIFDIIMSSRSIVPSKDKKIVRHCQTIADTRFGIGRQRSLVSAITIPSPFSHYLDFINHFVKLYNEKRADLEEQQLHLNVGLNKIAETVEQVEEMQKSLAVKSQVRGRGLRSKIWVVKDRVWSEIGRRWYED